MLTVPAPGTRVRYTSEHGTVIRPSGDPNLVFVRYDGDEGAKATLLRDLVLLTREDVPKTCKCSPDIPLSEPREHNRGCRLWAYLNGAKLREVDAP